VTPQWKSSVKAGVGRLTVERLEAAGKTARDTMLGLMKTCSKLKVSFYRFLGDRFAVQGAPIIEKLPTIVRLAVA